MLRFTLPVLCAVLFPLAASAGEIHQREVNQQQRIFSGVQQGALTHGEFRRLESRAAAIERTRLRDLKDSKLSASEKAQLTRRQNELSEAIYRQKHDAQNQR
jgi:hypothetical protein